MNGENTEAKQPPPKVEAPPKAEAPGVERGIENTSPLKPAEQGILKITGEPGTKRVGNPRDSLKLVAESDPTGTENYIVDPAAQDAISVKQMEADDTARFGRIDQDKINAETTQAAAETPSADTQAEMSTTKQSTSLEQPHPATQPQTEIGNDHSADTSPTLEDQYADVLNRPRTKEWSKEDMNKFYEYQRKKRLEDYEKEKQRRLDEHKRDKEQRAIHNQEYHRQLAEAYAKGGAQAGDAYMREVAASDPDGVGRTAKRILDEQEAKAASAPPAQAETQNPKPQTENAPAEQPLANKKPEADTVKPQTDLTSENTPPPGEKPPPTPDEIKQMLGCLNDTRTATPEQLNTLAESTAHLTDNQMIRVLDKIGAPENRKITVDRNGKPTEIPLDDPYPTKVEGGETYKELNKALLTLEDQHKDNPDPDNPYMKVRGEIAKALSDRLNHLAKTRKEPSPTSTPTAAKEDSAPAQQKQTEAPPVTPVVEPAKHTPPPPSEIKQQDEPANAEKFYYDRTAQDMIARRQMEADNAYRFKLMDEEKAAREQEKKAAEKAAARPTSAETPVAQAPEINNIATTNRGAETAPIAVTTATEAMSNTPTEPSAAETPDEQIPPAINTEQQQPANADVKPDKTSESPPEQSVHNTADSQDEATGRIREPVIEKIKRQMREIRENNIGGETDQTQSPSELTAAETPGEQIPPAINTEQQQPANADVKPDKTSESPPEQSVHNTADSQDEATGRKREPVIEKIKRQMREIRENNIGGETDQTQSPSELPAAETPGEQIPPAINTEQQQPQTTSEINNQDLLVAMSGAGGETPATQQNTPESPTGNTTDAEKANADLLQKMTEVAGENAVIDIEAQAQQKAIEDINTKLTESGVPADKQDDINNALKENPQAAPDVAVEIKNLNTTDKSEADAKIKQLEAELQQLKQKLEQGQQLTPDEQDKLTKGTLILAIIAAIIAGTFEGLKEGLEQSAKLQ